MLAAAHDADFARKVGVPQKVAKEFVEADKKARKYSFSKKKSGKKKVRR